MNLNKHKDRKSLEEQFDLNHCIIHFINDFVNRPTFFHNLIYSNLNNTGMRANKNF